MSSSNNADTSTRARQARRRLESAVNDLVESAGSNATAYVERTAARMKRQAALRRQNADRASFDQQDQQSGRHGDDDEDFEPPPESYHPTWRREPAWLWSDKPRSRSLYRNRRDGKILGVCAGVADYTGIETWVVRCLAVTALIFFNFSAVIGYFVAALILSDAPAEGHVARQVRRVQAKWQSRPKQRRRRSRRRSAEQAPVEPPDPIDALSARQRLRIARADLDANELRLRRIESHVTSGQYELQRELAKLANGSDGNG